VKLTAVSRPMRDLLLSVLPAYARGNQTKAAAILGISRKALWEKRKRFGLR
jgi:DNA-binding protein Fis